MRLVVESGSGTTYASVKVKSVIDEHPETRTGEPARHDAVPSVTLDDLDRAIMKMLRRDGRLPYAKIAHAVGVSKPTARKRVDRLMRAGAIVVAARVNPAPIGLPLDALICIRAARGRVKEVGSRLAEMENVAYLAYVAGSFDVVIQVYLPDAEGLFRFLNEGLAEIDGISSSEALHVLRTEKFFYNWEGEDVGLERSSRSSAARRTDEAMVRQGSMPHGTVTLDDLDRRIMKMLRRDGRLPYAQIARTAGVSEPTARKRVDRLVHAGALLIMARVDPGPIGFPLDAYVGIRVDRGRVKEVGSRLAEMENVAYLAYLAGSFDIMMQVYLPDEEGLFTFLTEDLEEIDGISYSETWHVLHTEKFFYNWEGEDIDLAPSAQRVAAD
jgi:DNA-binding Lrp family transcriptional regulator